MGYGLFYLPSSLPATRAEGAERFRTVIEQVAYGEKIGFESVWLAEHHFHPFAGIFSAPPVIGAAIAQRTEKMRIGTAVLLLPYHNPLRVAEDYATLDCLSNGRVEFGVGHGFVKWEALTFGIPLDELRDRFKENLDVILKAWRDAEARAQRALSRISRRRSAAAPGAGAVSDGVDGGDHFGGVFRILGRSRLPHDVDPVFERDRRAAREDAGLFQRATRGGT